MWPPPPSKLPIPALDPHNSINKIRFSWFKGQGQSSMPVQILIKSISEKLLKVGISIMIDFISIRLKVKPTAMVQY